MQVITPGYVYLLESHRPDGTSQTINFVRKEQLDSEHPELVEAHDGTTNEEVLAVLIDRMEHLNNRLPAAENHSVIRLLKRSLSLLESRTLGRKSRGVEGTLIK